MSADTYREGSLRELAKDLAASPYDPLRFLARGGMGEVVVVRHRELGRDLVMKLLLTNLTGQEQLAERMRAEARMLARLSHPSLVTVVDSGRTAAGRPFLVTELLEGETLAEHVAARGGHLPVRDALELTIQTLAGLTVVHDAGFVHRDLKPANLFVVKARGAEARRLKILDFGIAKALSEEDRRDLGMVAPTTAGAIMGTPSSVSPEQVESGKVDARTDVYGLGVVLFRIIVGRAPFSGDALELFRAHLLEAPPVPSSVAPQPVPLVVDRVILKALEKDPARRFQSASEMREALERVLVDLSLESDTTEDVASNEAATLEADFSGIARASASLQVAGSWPQATSDAEDGPTTRPVVSAAELHHGVQRAHVQAPSVYGPHVQSPSVQPAMPMGGTAVLPGPSAARKTEMLHIAPQAVAQPAAQPTVRLDAAEPLDSPWKVGDGEARPSRTRPRPEPVAPPKHWIATWGPIVAALVASVVLLLCLFTWKVL